MRSYLTIRACLCALLGALGILLASDVSWRFWTSWQNYANVQTSRSNALADRTILGALQALRFERSNSVSYLLMNLEQVANVRDVLGRTRNEVDTNFVRLREQSATFGDPSIHRKLAAALQAHEAFVALRARLDQALSQAVEQRDAKLSLQWTQTADRTLTALEDLSETLGERMKRLAPETQPYVNVRQYAWQARAMVGPGYSILSQAMAKQSPLTPMAGEEMAEAFGKAEGFWKLVGARAQGMNSNPVLVQSIADAQKAVFSPEAYASRRAIRDSLASGGNGDMSVTEFQKDNAVRQRSVLKVATDAMDALMELSENLAAQARREMLAMGAAIAATLTLCVGGFVLVQIRVIRPLSAMTSAMRCLSQGKLNAAVPSLRAPNRTV